MRKVASVDGIRAAQNSYLDARPGAKTQRSDLILKVPAGQVVQLENQDVAELWPYPDRTSDKYSRGVLGVDTGSEAYYGAALLNLAGALNSGVGMVRYAGPVPRQLLVSKYPSATFGEGRVQAWLVGSGWGAADNARLARRIADGVPMVVDAEAIASIGDAKLPENSLLTPHAGELARALGVERAEVEADPIGHAKAAAQKFGATVLLKGATQYVSDGESVVLAVPGSPWTAQAGSGDVLAGICGTLLAAMTERYPTILIGALAASIQAIAASANLGPFPPDRAASQLPGVIGGLAG